MNTTAWLCVSAVLLLVGYDVLVATHVIREPTISQDVRDYVAHYPALIAALGYLLGHLTWPQPPTLH